MTVPADILDIAKGSRRIFEQVSERICKWKPTGSR